MHTHIYLDTLFFCETDTHIMGTLFIYSLKKCYCCLRKYLKYRMLGKYDTETEVHAHPVLKFLCGFVFVFVFFQLQLAI